MAQFEGKTGGGRASRSSVSSIFCCRCLGRGATRAPRPLQPRHLEAAGALHRELPLGWESAWDPVYRHVYYFNRQTGERTWHEPWAEEAPGYVELAAEGEDPAAAWWDGDGAGGAERGAAGLGGAPAARAANPGPGGASAGGGPGPGGLGGEAAQVVKMSESERFRLEVTDGEGGPSAWPVITAVNFEVRKSTSSRRVKMWVESRAGSVGTSVRDRSGSPDSCSIVSGSHLGGASSTCTTRPPNSVSRFCLPDVDSASYAQAASAKTCDMASAGAKTNVAEDADADSASARGPLSHEHEDFKDDAPQAIKEYLQPDSSIQMCDEESQVSSPKDSIMLREDDDHPQRDEHGFAREIKKPTLPTCDSSEGYAPAATTPKHDPDAQVPEDKSQGVEDPAADGCVASSVKQTQEMAGDGNGPVPNGRSEHSPPRCGQPGKGPSELGQSESPEDGGISAGLHGACRSSNMPELHGISSMVWDGSAQGKEDPLRHDEISYGGAALKGRGSWPSSCWQEEWLDRARGRCRTLPLQGAGAAAGLADAWRDAAGTPEGSREERGAEGPEGPPAPGALEAGIPRRSLNAAMLIQGFECRREEGREPPARAAASALRAASPSPSRALWRRTYSLPARPRSSSPAPRGPPPGAPPPAAAPGADGAREVKEHPAIAPTGGHDREGRGGASGAGAPEGPAPAGSGQEPAAAAAGGGALGRRPVPRLELEGAAMDCSASSAKDFDFQSLSGREDSPSSFHTASNSSVSRSRFAARKPRAGASQAASGDAEDHSVECNRSVKSAGADTSCLSWQTAAEHAEGCRTPAESHASPRPQARQAPEAQGARAPSASAPSGAAPAGGAAAPGSKQGRDPGGRPTPDPAESPATVPQSATAQPEGDGTPVATGMPAAGHSASAGKGDPPRKGEPPRKGSGKGVPPGKGAPPAPGKGGGALGKGKGKAEPLKPEVTPRVPLKKLFWNPISLAERASGPRAPEETVWRRIHAEGARFDTAELEELFAEMPPELVLPLAEAAEGEAAACGGAAPAPAAAPRGPRPAARRRRVLEERRRRQLWFMLALMPELEVLLAAVARMDSSTLGPESVELLVLNLPTAEEASLLRQAAEVPLQEEEVWDTPEDFVLRVTDIPEYELRVKVWSFLNSFDPICTKLKAAAEDVATACGVLRNSERIQQLLALVLYVGNYLNGGTPRGRADGFDVETLPKLSAVKTSVALRREGNRGGANLLDFMVRQMEREYPGVLPHLYEAGNEAEWVHRARRHKLAEVGQELARLLTQAQDYHRRLKQHVPAADPLVGCTGETHACIVRLNDLSSSLEEVHLKYQSLGLWFHMDVQKLRPTDEFFALWDGFFLDLKRALDAAARPAPARAGPGARSTTPRLRTAPTAPLEPGRGPPARSQGAGARERGWTPPRRSAPALLSAAAPPGAA